MLKSIVLIIPYFGKFPNYFQLFLNSCRYNPTIHWIILTDNTKQYHYPENVKKITTSFRQIQRQIRNKFDFSVSIERPYKLCDFKPAYGYIFDTLIEGYDYWGYCDLDVIYGDIRAFLTEEVLSYPKIFELGHFTLIKNEKKYNELFMDIIHEKPYYKYVYSIDRNVNFDETFLDRVSINTIFQNNGLEIFHKEYAADIYVKSSSFVLVYTDGKIEKKKKSFFLWKDGRLARYSQNRSDGHISCTEYMYIHLQKRKMHIGIDMNHSNVYKIIPNRFDEIETEDIEHNFGKIKTNTLNLHYFRIRMKNMITKIKRKIKYHA